jgi:hypothetical protein
MTPNFALNWTPLGSACVPLEVPVRLVRWAP